MLRATTRFHAHHCLQQSSCPANEYRHLFQFFLTATLMIIFGATTAHASNPQYDGPAELPIATVSSTMADTPASGALITVNAGENLQSALNSAQCGDVLELEAGATFTGQFIVPAKSCNINNWIIIRTSSYSSLPAEGQRLTPCYAGVASLEGRPAYSCSNPQNVTAKVQNQDAGDGPFLLANGANFYRFVGLEVTRAAGTPGMGRLMVGSGTADHIIIDRSWLHGGPQDMTYNGVTVNGMTNVAIVDSYFSDFHCVTNTTHCVESYAIGGGVSNTQDGPFKFEDNFLEASGEGIIFGGGAATKSPNDIEILNNHFWKPWQWMPGSPNFVGGTNGKPFIVKNHLEIKNAVRVLVDSNLMENNWGGFSQRGYSILLTPKNQHSHHGNVCPQCEVTDITVRYSHVSHVGGGLVMATALGGNGKHGRGQALAGTRFSIHDVIFDDINTNYVGDGTLFYIANGWSKNPLNTFTINHITGFPDSSAEMIVTGNLESNPQMYGFVFTNNLVITGQDPVWNRGGGHTSCAYSNVPVTTIDKCFATSNSTFANNGLITPPSQYPPSKWPSNNFFAKTVNAVDFTNFNNGDGGNYELLSGSPYKNKGTDGKDLGADIVAVNEALANVE